MNGRHASGSALEILRWTATGPTSEVDENRGGGTPGRAPDGTPTPTDGTATGTPGRPAQPVARRITSMRLVQSSPLRPDAIARS